MLKWPPPYSLRRSARAKHLQLRVCPTRGLEVVVPARSKKVDVDALLLEKKSWLEKHQHLLVERSSESIVVPWPRFLYLKSFEECWHVVYCQTFQTRLTLKVQPSYTLFLKGDLQDPLPSQQRLVQWLKEHAREKFRRWLSELCVETGLEYRSLQVRGQKTLWGSCNQQKEISLNYKLLFVPSAWARYVLLHELCHTVYLNHSKRFWNLLSRFDPNCRMHARLLRGGDQQVPRWLYHF